MPLTHLLARYGLPAIFLGAGFEGETAVVTGGILAHAGLVPLAGACVAAVTGSFAADQLFFFIGRHWREARPFAWLRAKPLYARALALVERRPIGFTFAFRFIYGFRTVSPFAIGTSQVPARLFLVVNAIAAAVWGTLFTLIGFFFGRAFGAVMHRLQPSRSALMVGGAVLAVAALVAWLVIRRRRRAI